MPRHYPDDFDNVLYRQYRPSMRSGWWLNIRRAFSRLVVTAMILLGLGAGFVVAGLALPTATRVVVVTDVPTPTAVGDITGAFPANVPQISIIVPAKIDNELGVEQSRGYRFFARAGTTWDITIITDGQLDTVLSVYSPDGTILGINDDLQPGNRGSSLRFTATETAQYGVLIAANGVSAGGYTLSISAVVQ